MKQLKPAWSVSKRLAFADWVGRYALPVLTILTAISGAFLTYDWEEAAEKRPGLATMYQVLDQWVPTFFFVFAISALCASILQSVVQPKLKLLAAKVGVISENFRTLCDGAMADLAAKVAINRGDEARTSLYLHDEANGFVLLGRYSPNPVLRRPGRTHYPEGEGCIGEAWRLGWCFDNDLGEGADFNQKCSEQYAMSEASLQVIRMRARMIAAHRIDRGTEFLGVIVIESMNSEQFVSGLLQTQMEQAANDLAPLLTQFKDLAPRPSIASGLGF